VKPTSKQLIIHKTYSPNVGLLANDAATSKATTAHINAVFIVRKIHSKNKITSKS